MPTEGLLGDGVKIAYSETSPMSWVELPQLMDLPKPPSPTPDKLETTTHGTAGFHTYGTGLKDVPDIEAVFLFDPDKAITPSHVAMITHRDAKTILWFRIETPSNVGKTEFIAWDFQARVQAADIETPKDNWQLMNLSLVYAGGYSFYDTPAASAI